MSVFTNKDGTFERRAVRPRTPRVRRLASAAVLAATSSLLVGWPAVGSSSASPSPAVPFVAATVTGSSSSSWTVSWWATGTTEVKVYEGSDATGATHYVGQGHASGSLTVAGMPEVSREWFRLVPNDRASLVIAERDLGLSSVPNLRDIGGYRTSSGDWVRMGVVYRSQALAPLSATDLAAIDQLGITDVYDLRTPSEASAKPDDVPSGAAYHLLNVFGTVDPEVQVGSTAAQSEQGMIAMNRQFVTGAPDRAALGRLITDIAESTGAQVYNCTAGKDRTGWATAVILTLLGVPRSTVMRDYLLSNTYYLDSPSVQGLITSSSPTEAAVLSAVLDVSPTYLQAGFDQVTRSYGSMYNYVVRGMGVRPSVVSKLRERLLVT